ncbi:MAG: ABC transporter ATP-binding protein, partial [Nitrospirae bacterium]|nr:ABC transporter ATP-binding protein [Nitrospirota bacterium]
MKHESQFAIEAINITKTYPNGIRALDGVSFGVSRGEVFGLLGANGAGKTTLIKIITTLLKPNSGNVKVLEMDVQQHPVKVKKMLGVVSQDINLDTYLTVKQNLFFQCRYFGVNEKEEDKRIAEWMELLGLKDYANEKIYTLSGGTKRKVMVARSFITDPEILVLDEPTSGLDPVVREVVWERILRFKKSGRTVLLSTHHFEEA